MIAQPTEKKISAVKAAKELGMSRQTFYRFARKHGIREVATNPNLERPKERLYIFADVLPFLLKQASTG